MDATAPPAPVDPAGGEKEGRWLERPKWDRPGADELPPPQEFSAEDIRQLDEFLAQFDD